MRPLLLATAMLPILGVPAVLFLAGDRGEASPPPAASIARPVQVAEIRLAPATDIRAYTGVVRARREADVGFRTGGRITARLVDVGTRVAAGQPLARIDPADLALALRLGTDRAFREAMRARILDRNAVLYANDATVAAIGDFLERAVGWAGPAAA